MQSASQHANSGMNALAERVIRSGVAESVTYGARVDGLSLWWPLDGSLYGMAQAGGHELA